MSEIIYTFTTWILPLLLCLVLHEVAHGWAALALGDTTARDAGRLTLNPKEHIDPVGSLLLPGILLVVQSPVLFGWAKAVPVVIGRLRRPKRDMGLVALAGPVANFVLAIIFVLIGRFVLPLFPVSSAAGEWVFENLKNGIGLTLVLCIFNLIPLLPLDGGRILASILPLKYSFMYQRTEPYGWYVLMGLVFILPVLSVDVIGWFIGTFYPMLANVVLIFG